MIQFDCIYEQQTNYMWEVILDLGKTELKIRFYYVSLKEKNSWKYKPFCR